MSDVHDQLQHLNVTIFFLSEFAEHSAAGMPRTDTLNMIGQFVSTKDIKQSDTSISVYETELVFKPDDRLSAINVKSFHLNDIN